METYIPRELEAAVRRLLRQFPAVAVTGPRQSGKSTLLRHMLPDYAYVSLDDPITRRRALDDPELLLDRAGERVILDEVQNVPGLMSYLKMRIDRQRSVRGRFVLTGSQQFVLMKGLSDSLAGRIGLLELLPFSLGEAARGGMPAATGAAFERACLRGLFPELVADPTVDSHAWYSAYIQTYLERDIHTLYDIGHLREFDRCVQLLAARCAQVLNLSTLAADIGVSVNTVKKWISILEACRTIHLLPPYFANLGKRLIKAPKVYFLDCGLVCYLTGLRDADPLLNGPMAGPLFENFCVQEAIKATVHLGARPRFYYLRTRGGLEVDFLVQGANGRLRPFEFKLARTPRLELGDALRRFRREFEAVKPEPGAVVSLADRADSLDREVRLLPLADFIAEVRGLAYV